MAFSSAALHTLGELLSSFKFHIPDYQRGYSWGETQLQALWNDLKVAVSSPANQHFTGIVLLKKLGLASDSNSVELVDGQQRVISTIALASALSRRVAHFRGAPSEVNRFCVKFEDNAELQSHFDYWILGDETQAARIAPECSSYALNLQKAGKFFTSRAQELSQESAAEHLDSLLKRFCLFVLDVQPQFDIHVAFETLNNRGKKLSHLELLKNRLIYLTNVLPEDHAKSPAEGKGQRLTGETLRRQIHLAWKGIYRSLGRSSVTQNHDDEFLRAHAIAYFGEVKDSEWLEKILLEQTFAVTNQTLDLRFIQVYIQHLEQAACWWSHMHDAEYMPKPHQLRLDRIARVGHAYFKPLILAAYMRIGSIESATLVQPSEHSAVLLPVLPLLEQIERYIVLVLVLSGRPAHLGRADMTRMSRALMRPDEPIPGYWTQKRLHEMAPADAVAFCRDYVQAYIENREVDDSWTDPRFEWVGAFSESDVALTVASRLRNGDGYYKWAFTRLLLLEYEESRRGSGNKPRAIKWPWDEFSFDTTVEHIFPQNAEREHYWNEVIPIDGRAKGLKSAVVHSLGNLMLLSTKANSSVSTLPFVSRTGKCKRNEFAQGSYSETQVAHVFANYHWNVAAIAARGVAMLKFAEARWKFNLTEDSGNYASYLPLLFGEKAEDIRTGNASSGKMIDNRSLNPLVTLLLE